VLDKPPNAYNADKSVFPLNYITKNGFAERGAKNVLRGNDFTICFQAFLMEQRLL
jgi:hypothetical protein